MKTCMSDGDGGLRCGGDVHEGQSISYWSDVDCPECLDFLCPCRGRLALWTGAPDDGEPLEAHQAHTWIFGSTILPARIVENSGRFRIRITLPDEDSAPEPQFFWRMTGDKAHPARPYCAACQGRGWRQPC